MERWEAMRMTEWDSMKRVLLLSGVEVLNPETGKKVRQDVMIKDGHVRLVAAGDHPDDAVVFDLTGKIAVPGLVDIHVHLREPGDEDAETIASGTAAAARGGFVAVASMANTKPPIDNPQSVRFVLERARQAGMCRVYPMAAVSQGLEGKALTEMFDLAEAGAVAFSDDGKSIMDANLMRQLNTMSFWCVPPRASAPQASADRHFSPVGTSGGGIDLVDPLSLRVPAVTRPAQRPPRLRPLRARRPGRTLMERCSWR